MPREKFQTLTEQMFYTLLCLKTECCGTDIMGQVSEMTNGRVKVGPGTLYNLLEQFLDSGLIMETESVGRRRNYILTKEGERLLEEEYDRLQKQVADYTHVFRNPEKEGK